MTLMPLNSAYSGKPMKNYHMQVFVETCRRSRWAGNHYTCGITNSENVWGITSMYPFARVGSVKNDS
jgi:hypothetical protein